MSTPQPIATLHWTQLTHEVDHDGYCSDPGEDYGDTVSEKRTMDLDADAVKILFEAEFIADDLTIEDHKLACTDGVEDWETNCGSGSGYCGYKNYSRPTNGYITLNVKDSYRILRNLCEIDVVSDSDD